MTKHDFLIKRIFRKNCFTSDYFKGCLDVLLMQDAEDLEWIQTAIKTLHGADPGV